MPAFLYIEDHPASQMIMQLLLTRVLGYEDLVMLDDTANVLERLDAMQKTFDVIFLDVNLKPLDGLAVCRMLRTEERFHHARIIGLTANASAAEQRNMKEVGFDGMITKPISHKTFPVQLQRILEGEIVWEVE
jgi:two-component system alkaline phosphatase synthesis response regulator PhoP